MGAVDFDGVEASLFGELCCVGELCDEVVDVVVCHLAGSGAWVAFAVEGWDCGGADWVHSESAGVPELAADEATAITSVVHCACDVCPAFNVLIVPDAWDVFGVRGVGWFNVGALGEDEAYAEACAACVVVGHCL